MGKSTRRACMACVAGALLTAVLLAGYLCMRGDSALAAQWDIVLAAGVLGGALTGVVTILLGREYRQGLARLAEHLGQFRRKPSRVLQSQLSHPLADLEPIMAP